MEEDLNTIDRIVCSIQEDIYESSGEVEYFNISLHTNGFVQMITFCDIVLWSSEDDERRYYEEETTMEFLESFLRRKLREELKKLSRIRI